MQKKCSASVSREKNHHCICIMAELGVGNWHLLLLRNGYFTNTWLQLAFPAYVILLVVLVTIISSYSSWFSNFIGKKNPVATLASLASPLQQKTFSIPLLPNSRMHLSSGLKLKWTPIVKYHCSQDLWICDIFDLNLYSPDSDIDMSAGATQHLRFQIRLSPKMHDCLDIE